MLNPYSIFYNFCHSVGHEEKYCRAYDFLLEITMHTYFRKGGEQQTTERPQPQPLYNQPQPQYNQPQLQYNQP